MKIDIKANRRRRVYRECGCIFGLCSKSSSSATTQNIQQQVGASEGSLALGVGANYQEAGATSLGDVSGKIGTTDLAVGGDVTVSTSDVAVLTKTLDTISELSSGFGSSLNAFVSQQSADQDKKVASLITAIDSARETEDSAAQNRKIFTWIALAVLGFFAFLSFSRHR